MRTVDQYRAMVRDGGSYGHVAWAAQRPFSAVSGRSDDAAGASQQPESFMHQPLGPDRTRVGVLVQKHESSLEFFQQIAHFFLDITTEFRRAPGVAIRYSCF